MCLWQQNCFGNHLGLRVLASGLPVATVTGHQEQVPANQGPSTPLVWVWQPPSVLSPPPPILLDPQQQETRPQQPRRWPSRSRPLGLPGPGSSALSTLPPCSACHLRTRCPCWGGVNPCGLTQGSFFECAGSCPAKGPTHPAGSASSPRSRLGQRMGSVWLLSTCPNRFTCRLPFSLALLASLRMLPAHVAPAGPRLRVQAHPSRGA